MKLNSASTKPMIKILMTLSLIAAISINAFSATQERQVGSFNKIDASGPFLITLLQNQQYAGKIIIDGTDQNISRVVTNVKDQELNISMEGMNIRTKAIELTIYIDDLKSIDLNGAVYLQGTSTLKFTDLSIDCSGSSVINLELTADKLKLDTSGKSSISLSGKANSLDIDFSGASEFKGEKLVLKHASIDCSGASVVSVHAIETLSIEASGSSVIKYSGSPRILKRELSGTSILTQF